VVLCRLELQFTNSLQPEDGEERSSGYCVKSLTIPSTNTKTTLL
jgi:hypothetical protein